MAAVGDDRALDDAMVGRGDAVATSGTLAQGGSMRDVALLGATLMLPMGAFALWRRRRHGREKPPEPSVTLEMGEDPRVAAMTQLNDAAEQARETLR